MNITPGGFGALRACDVGFALAGLPRPQFLAGMLLLAGDYGATPALQCLLEARVEELAAVQGWPTPRRRDTLQHLCALALFEALHRPDEDSEVDGGKARCFACRGSGAYRPPAQACATDPRELAAERREMRQALRRLKRLEWQAARIREELEACAGDRDAQRRAAQRLKRVLAWISKFVQLTALDPLPAKCEICRGSGRQSMQEWCRAFFCGLPRREWYRGWNRRYDEVRLELQGWKSDALTHVRERLEERAA